MTRAFRVNLSALSLLALVVGAFLIYNAMAFSVVQRWNLLGALRGLGAAPGDIARLVCREALALSVLGSALGVLAGAVLGRGLVSLVARTLNDLYFATHVAGLRLDPWILAKGGLLGLGLGLLAALEPAWQAARIRPRVLLTRSAQESRLRGRLPRLNLAGALAAALSALMAWLPGRSLAAGFASLALAVAAWALWTPDLLRRLSAGGAWALGRAAALAGRRGSAITLGRMAAREAGASLSRTGVAAAALMAALSVTVAMGIMVDSFRRAVRDWLEAVLVADVYASAPRAGSGRLEGSLDPAWLEAARALPGVAGVTGYLAVTLNVPEAGGSGGDGGPLQLLALDMDGRSRAAFRFLEGDSASAWPAFHRLPGCAVLVSEPFAYRRRLHPGMAVRLPTPAGPRDFPVAGVFADYGTDRGAAMMDRACYDAHWRGRGHTSAAFYARAGVSADSLARSLGRLPGSGGVEIRPSRALRAASLEIFDRTFAITSVLRLAAVIIAAIGLVGALAALELERSPETALLRALGLTPRQTWALASAQAAFLGLCTGLLAVPLGLAQAGLLVHVINRRSFGWSLPLHADPWICLQAVLLGLGAALLAAVLPAWRSSRAVTARALREE
jgi:putative ABC transport system permease protein